ncbi:von Willebrand and RING finger domain protein [Rhizodiscina lignyota]|uniref:von Willebrand and RING finger domain protein n=1 Tax=Rhizodiscina lignyota TaxID=1504668 RepID=A0A9P4IG53_9PEZI|nr:von Willebrand and RING finger domain protein [Rhizodiscina lignyota]
MAGVLDLDRTGNRRDRTFVGAECAVCEEPLEHTLRGERILQLTCAHVAHEACFYEYIREFEAQTCPACDAPLGLDSSRGGNVLDMGKLNNLVKSNRSLDLRDDPRDGYDAATPWDRDPRPDTSRSASARDVHYGEKSQARDFSENNSSRLHNRNDSGVSGPSNEYADPHAPVARRHDFDVQSMETTLNSPKTANRNPIPAPHVTIRSEFPTLTRSRQQQSLTCLVTVEVAERKWKHEPEPESSQRAQTTTKLAKAPSQNFVRATPMDQSVAERLRDRVDNWHGLDVSRFGKLHLHAHIRVGKDRRTWQDLECYLFSEMLICVKEKRVPSDSQVGKVRCNLKGSILIKKHLRQVDASMDELVLTLTLSVAELPQFHLHFRDPDTLEVWKIALMQINSNQQPILKTTEYDQDNSGTDEDDFTSPKTDKRLSSVHSSYAGRSYNTAATEYSSTRNGVPDMRLPAGVHVPLDIVVVIPVSSSMQGLKITLLRDTLRFLVANLGERDRMGLVTFGSSGGGVPIVGMTSKAWSGWPQVLESIKPLGQKSLRADVVEGANVAMDLLMQRKSTNPLSSILLISDSSTSDPESVDFVVSRAEAAKVTIHSFGLGLTHKPDTMIELSTRTKASYTYVKDWNALRECVAGCLGSLQSTSHQNAKLKLRLPEGSPAKFVKISGAMHITKRATGKDAEAALGNLRFGDKRDVLVQLAIEPDNSAEQAPHDAWESIVSGLEALGGADPEDPRPLSVEEVPLIQADLVFGDVLREGQTAHLPRPTLLTITVLPASGRPKSIARAPSPPIPPHPSVVQRRMELLTSDMLTRALTLVSRNQHDRAQQLLTETRSILKGLGKGSLPPLPPPPGKIPPTPNTPKDSQTSPTGDSHPDRRQTPSPHNSTASKNSFNPASGIDPGTMAALDAEIESSLEWINHPAVFSRDSRKAVLQAIGIISSQRGYTFRTPIEVLWAERIPGVKQISDREKEWRDMGLGEEALTEE